MKLAVALIAAFFFSSNCETVYAFECEEISDKYRATQALATGDLACLKTAVTTADEANVLRFGTPIAFSTLHPPGQSDSALRYLLDTGLDPDIKDYQQSTILGYAIAWGRVAAAEMLIDAGADVNQGFRFLQADTWPLRAATASGNSDLVVKLLEAGAHVNHISTRWNGSLLDTAVRLGDPQILRTLLEAGADVEDSGRIEKYGTLPPLETAARDGNIEIGRVLLEHHAHVNRQSSRRGNTALHTASKFGQYEFVELLINAGAALHLKNSWGGTALHAATSSGEANVVRLLIAAGADVHLKDNHGRSSLQLAKDKGYGHLISN